LGNNFRTRHPFASASASCAGAIHDRYVLLWALNVDAKRKEELLQYVLAGRAWFDQELRASLHDRLRWHLLHRRLRP
jgi:hypothetical protein